MFSNPTTLRILGKALLDAAEAMEEKTQTATAPPPATATDSQGFEVVDTVPPYNAATPVDVDGIPWDTRIHASTQTKTVPGQWKLAKGVDKALVGRLIASYAAAGWGPQTAAAPPPPAAQTAAAPPPPAAAASVTDFASFVKHANGLIAGGQATWDSVNAVCKSMGLNGFTDLNAQPTMIPAVVAGLPSAS